MTTERTTWLKTRDRLKTYDYDENWEKVITLFKNRIENKFFVPIEVLLKNRNNNGTGFSIVSIQCLLIELFATFRSGKIHNPRYNENNDPSYQFKDCADAYTSFLHEANIFKDHFFMINENGEKEFDKPYKASNFYSEVRCGLLHEGKTKKKWTINLKPRSEKINGFIKTTGGKVKIYRTILHKYLLEYLNSYVEELRSDSENSKNLRRNFSRKMDNLYGFKPNTSKYDWWNE